MRAPVAGLALLDESKQRIRRAGEQHSFKCCLQGVFNGGKGFAVPNLLHFKRDAAQFELLLDTAGRAGIALIQIAEAAPGARQVKTSGTGALIRSNVDAGKLGWN